MRPPSGKLACSSPLPRSTSCSLLRRCMLLCITHILPSPKTRLLMCAALDIDECATAR